jgi:LuxR family transcriptional regulator, maltose regulon positive regulatory protein
VSASASVNKAVERGRQALARGGWEEARACFEEALEGSQSAEAWEGLSWAAWWLEDGVRAIEARERAYGLYREAGDLRGAARVAIWLANDHIDFRGEEAVAQGWFARCERILEGLEPSPEHGWLAALQGAMALEEGDTAAARRLGSQARELGRAWKLTDLEMVGVATEGLALVSEGTLERGMRCLDEATAAALGGEYEELQPVCWTCCNLRRPLWAAPPTSGRPWASARRRRWSCRRGLRRVAAVELARTARGAGGSAARGGA